WLPHAPTTVEAGGAATASPAVQPQTAPKLSAKPAVKPQRPSGTRAPSAGPAAQDSGGRSVLLRVALIFILLIAFCIVGALAGFGAYYYSLGGNIGNADTPQTKGTD